MKKLYNISLLDDKDYWIRQIITSIPPNLKYDFKYFDTYEKIKWHKSDILFLDYFLDKDWLTWVDIIQNLDADIIIWFSSIKQRSDEIEMSGWNFSIQKLMSPDNAELKQLMNNLLNFD